MSEKEFLEYLKNTQRLFLYGAGTVAKRVLRFCKENGIVVEGIIVTETAKNAEKLEGIYVRTLTQWRELGIAVENMDVLVSIAVAEYGGTCCWNDELIDIPFHSRFILPGKTNEWLKKWLLEENVRVEAGKLDGYEVLLDDSNAEQNHTVIIRSNNRQKFCRCELQELGEQIDSFIENCRIESFENEFGKVRLLPLREKEYLRNPKTENFESYVVMSHLDKASPAQVEEEGFVPIQVGAALTDIRKGCLTDDTGVNISAKNRDYSECTALYWIWKNTSGQQYVGLNHYRRRLLLDDDSISYIKENDIDVVLALPHFCAETVREFFMRFVSKCDWHFLKDKIVAENPDYLPLWEQYENGHFLFHGNLALWKREWFDQYCEFVFKIAEEIEEEYAKRGIIRQDRYMGFLFENLTGFFVMAHRTEMRVACTEMKWIGK